MSIASYAEVRDMVIRGDNGINQYCIIAVDARSLLGLFALIGKPCKLVAEDSTDYKILARAARKAGVA